MKHPLWDEAHIGELEHAQLAGRFLERFGEYVHGLELNGLRPWRENRRVTWMAGHSGNPMVEPLSAYWQGNEPWLMKWFLGGLRAVTNQQVRTALRVALSHPQEVQV